MKKKRDTPEEQGSLFAGVADTPARTRTRPSAAEGEKAWKMPEVSGKTVAEVRLRWSKRLTPAQVAKVERELGRLPGVLTKLGFGTVQVERSFVRRRKN